MATIRILRQGNTSKRHPFTVLVVANPALEAPYGSGTFTVDPVMSAQPTFDACANYIHDALFQGLPNQREPLLADPALSAEVRLVSIFDSARGVSGSSSLVGQHGASNLLVARRNAVRPFVLSYDFDEPDVVYAVSASASHSRASAWFTTDDPTRGGRAFTWNGSTFLHCYYNQIPGTIAIHVSATSLTATHEFGHAISSYQNGGVVDLYVDSPHDLNCEVGRPIPLSFQSYQGVAYGSDSTRDHIGYPAGWQSFHCELSNPATPAIMDNYWQTTSPNSCQHDRITRAFVMDRLYTKTKR